ncbi:MAG: hypothetical protein K6G00_13220 [Treponema sp.]|nr:hypothetical protein [Treponema sp.]
MFDFKYYTPTKVVFGKNTEEKVADLIHEFGGKKVLIHYGGGSVLRSGLLQRVTCMPSTVTGCQPTRHLGNIFRRLQSATRRRSTTRIFREWAVCLTQSTLTCTTTQGIIR